MAPGLLAAFICFAVFLITQIVLVHLIVVTNRLKAMALTWLVLLALYVALYGPLENALPAALLPAEGLSDLARRVNFVNGALVYLMMFLSYACFYYTDHSLCLAYMIEFESRPLKKMTIEEIKQHFSYDALLAGRLDDLVANHYVVREGEQYRLAPKGQLFAGTLGTIKRMLKLEPGG
jgi:hypothetical protein